MAEQLVGIDQASPTSLERCFSTQQLDLILNGDYLQAFDSKVYFSEDASNGHIFDVINGNGLMRSNIGGDRLMEIVKVG